MGCVGHVSAFPFLSSRMRCPPAKTKSNTDASKVMSKDSIGGAFAHVKEHACSLSDPNVQLQWIYENVNDPDSPLYGWPKQEVKEILRNELTTSSKSKVRDFHPLNMRDFNKRFFETFHFLNECSNVNLTDDI